MQIILTGIGTLLWLWFTLAYLRVGSDLVQDYTAARMLLAGRSIYGEGITEYAIRELGIPGIENFHPPFNAIFYIPLALIPWPFASVVMNAISLLAWIWLVREVADDAGLGRVAARWFTAAALLWHPFVATIGLTQISVFVAAGVYLTWQCLRGGRSAVAGLLLGLLVQLKLFPLLLLFYPVLKRDWRALAWAFLFTLLFAALILATVGTGAIDQYAFRVMPDNVREWVPFPVNYSLHGTLAQFFSQSGWISNAPLFSLTSVSRFSTVLSALLAILVVMRSYTLVRAGLDERAFAALTAAALLFSPLCWQHYFCILLPGLVIASRLAAGARSSALRWIWLLLMASLFVPDVRFVDLMVEFFQPSKIPAPAFLLTRLPALFLWTQLLVLLAFPAVGAARGSHRAN